MSLIQPCFCRIASRFFSDSCFFLFYPFPRASMLRFNLQGQERVEGISFKTLSCFRGCGRGEFARVDTVATSLFASGKKYGYFLKRIQYRCRKRRKRAYLRKILLYFERRRSSCPYGNLLFPR